MCHNGYMGRKGSNEHFAERRARGLALLAEGKTSKQVAEILEATKRSVDRWHADVKKPTKKKATRPVGRPRKLSEKQMKRLEKALDKGAYAFGYAGDYWTLDRIAQVLFTTYDIQCGDRLFCDPTQRPCDCEIPADCFGRDWSDMHCIRVGAALACITLAVWDEAD
jgi:transposase